MGKGDTLRDGAVGERGANLAGMLLSKQRGTLTKRDLL